MSYSSKTQNKYYKAKGLMLPDTYNWYNNISKKVLIFNAIIFVSQISMQLILIDYGYNLSIMRLWTRNCYCSIFVLLYMQKQPLLHSTVLYKFKDFKTTSDSPKYNLLENQLRSRIILLIKCVVEQFFLLFCMTADQEETRPYDSDSRIPEPLKLIHLDVKYIHGLLVL